ncbi:MAG: TIR domain-containing protein [Ruminococcaceae bacterium]|nr:TIR domain-containing protein [Oscillospiraceae bacterium]
MATLLYKTRGSASPQGKPKVYLCCHPEDAERFTEAVCDELLQKQNCAVWYLEDPHAVRDEELLDDLKSMQLFVMPVTRRLLSTENPAIDTEFAFATEHHIPVLPLMQEDGLDVLFNERCGDLQYLSRFVSDPTAIPYDEKLANYLSSVLIGDELAEKIRAAFDAYVFLSYRKKDRRYAQELMCLIHKHDFARDIAIWYDEFLTPGENFTDAIRKALRDSELFVLAVTPHLTEPDNYVMTTEYPLAREEGKPVLPAQMCPTDRDALAGAFDGIPACTDAHDDAAMSDALLDALRAVACRENDTPEHNFFIGLAYLGGVDVEVDRDRALTLITSAAEEGLTEALDKLVEMYRNGIGVERNFRTAIHWLERKAQFAQKRYTDNPTEENANDLFWCFMDCGDALKGIADLDGAKAYYQKGLELRVTLADETGTVEARRDLSVSYERLGDIAKAQGDLDGAKAYYQKGLELSLTLADETGTVQARRDLSISYNKLGDIAETQGDLDAAKTYYQKGLELRVTLADETGTVEARRDLSISYERLGDIAKVQGDLDGAKAYYQKGLELRVTLADETGTVEARRDLSVSYDKSGDIAEAQGDLDGAKTYYQKGLELAVTLADETGTVEARRDLSVSYERLGGIAEAQGDLDGAKAYYQKSLELAVTLADETETVQARRDLSISYNKLGDIAKVQGDLDGAKTYYQKDLELAVTLADETGTVEARRDLSVSYEKLGDIAKAQGDLDGAKTYYQKDLELSLTLADETGTVLARRDLSVSYNRLGDIAEAQGDLDGAKAYYQKGLELRITLADETGTAESIDDLAISHYKLAFVSDTAEKVTHLREALRLFTLLCEQCPQVPIYRQRRDIVQSELDKLTPADTSGNNTSPKKRNPLENELQNLFNSKKP